MNGEEHGESVPAAHEGLRPYKESPPGSLERIQRRARASARITEALDEEEPADEDEPADPCPYHGRDEEVDELERLLLDSQRENELLKGKNWRLEVQVADLIAERESSS